MVKANPIIVDIWPSIPDSVNLNDRYWINDEHTYHESNLELGKSGFSPVACLVTLGERKSLKRDGIAYEFFPIDDQSEDSRRQISSSLFDYLHQLEPDIIVIHLLNRRISNILLEDSCLKAKKILQINTYHIKGNTFDWILINPDCVDAYFVNSSSLAKILIEGYLIPKHKVLVLPSAVDPGRFFPDKRVIKKWDLVWTGQLREDDDKRVEIFITLVKKTGCSMMIIGDGPKRAILEQMARDEGCKSLIDFWGWIQYDNLPALLNQASIYVTAASLDPSSRSLTEALSCGLPAVGFADCLGLEEQIFHGSNGFLAKDIDDMASLLNRILNHQDLYNQMSERSIKIAKQRFGKKRRVKIMLQTFNKLLGEKPNAR